MYEIQKPTYTQYQLKRELSEVFKSVHFPNKYEKLSLQQSYFMNFDALVEYARDNNIDEMRYIRSIRDTLLADGKVCKTRKIRQKWNKGNVR